MSLWSKSLKKFIWPIFFLFLSIYFTYHIFEGKRGIWAFVKLKSNLDQEKKELARLQMEKTELERLVQLLKPNSLDLDLLEERARVVLNYTDPQEIILLKKDLIQ